MTPMSWTDHHLLSFRVATDMNLCRGDGLMNPTGFQNELEELSTSFIGGTVNVLTDLYKMVIARTVALLFISTLSPPRFCHTLP